MYDLYKAIKPYVEVAHSCTCEKEKVRNLMCKNIESTLVQYNKLVNVSECIAKVMERLNQDELIPEYTIKDSGAYIEMWFKFSSYMFNDVYFIRVPKAELPSAHLKQYLNELEKSNESYIY